MAASLSKTKLVFYSAVGIVGYLLTRRITKKLERLDLYGKVVVITGGSRGLGLVLARHLAGRGARIAICARDAEHLAEAHSELKDFGADVLSTTADLTDQSQVDRAIENVVDHFGRIDVLINNAGIIQVGPQESQSLADYEKAMAINFWAALYTTLAEIPHFQKQKEGRIVNIGSIGGKIAIPHMLPYTVSKFALVGLSEGMRAELSKHNILVTTIIPNLIRTGSPRNVTVKGKHKLEYAWFNMADSSRLLAQSADRAAEDIIEALEKGNSELFLSKTGRFAYLLQAAFPGAMSSLMAFLNRLLPNSGKYGQLEQKGYESESVLSRVAGKQSLKAAGANNEF